MKTLNIKFKNKSVFEKIVFGKQKKGLIFALAITKDSDILEKWQSGRMRQS